MISTAISLATAIPYIKGKKRLACVAVDKRGRILSIGYNSYTKTSPRQQYYAKKAGMPLKCYLHAELDACVKARGKIHSLYVARVLADGSTACAKPCPVCELAIEAAGIKNVVWTEG